MRFSLALALLLRGSLGAQETPDAVLERGLALARDGRYEQAAQVLRSGRTSYPADARFAVELAGVAFRQKHLNEARTYLHAALRLRPDDAYSNEFLANLYLLDGNLAAALKYWNRVAKPLIQSLTVDPTPRLHPALVDRAVAVSGGQIFTPARLASTEMNLARLGVFAGHRFELSPRQDGRFDATLHLRQRGSGLAGWMAKMVSLARGLPYQAVHLDLLNLGQEAIHLRSLWRWDPYRRRVNIEIAGPIRRDPRYGFRWVADARDEEWIQGVHVQKAETGFDLVFPVRDWTWTTGVRVNRRWHFINAVGYVQRNELSAVLWRWPERRVRLDGAVTLDTGRANGRYGRARADVEASWARGPWAARARARLGTAWGRVPFDELFQLGVERDNELWLRGHAGSREGRKGAAPLGRRFGLMQADVDRTVWRWTFVELKAGPFFDLGWMRPGGWMPDAGAQTRIRVMGGLTWTFVYGRDLRGGRGVFFTSVGS